MRSILAVFALGMLAVASAVYLLSAPPPQDSALARSDADRAAAKVAVAVEAWPICSSMASLAESADWAALDPDFAAGKRAIVAGDWTGAIKTLTSAGLRDDVMQIFRTISGTPIAVCGSSILRCYITGRR
jgi:hypothetical protein